MKVLMFSTDKSILETGSPAQERMVEYGQLAEKLFIVILFKKRAGGQVLDIGQNVKVYAKSFWGAWWLGKFFKNNSINLVTAQDPFETGFLGYLAARRIKAKLQLQIHTDFLSPYFIKESLKNRVRVSLAKWLLPKADSIRVVSERIKKSVVGLGLSKEKIIVLPIFVNVQKIKNTPIVRGLWEEHQKLSQFNFFVLMVSRLSKEKNISLAIDAMSEVIKKYPKAGLIIFGDGPEKKKLQCLADKAQLKNNIEFQEWDRNWTNYLAQKYKSAQIFLNTSNYEGYGRTLIEAAAAGGAAIVTTDVGVVGEAINKDNSLIIPVGDRAALEQAITKLIEDEKLRDELSQKAQIAVQSLGTKESYLQRYKQSWQI